MVNKQMTKQNKQLKKQTAPIRKSNCTKSAAAKKFESKTIFEEDNGSDVGFWQQENTRRFFYEY